MDGSFLILLRPIFFPLVHCSCSSFSSRGVPFAKIVVVQLVVGVLRFCAWGGAVLFLGRKIAKTVVWLGALPWCSLSMGPRFCVSRKKYDDWVVVLLKHTETLLA
ncbi:hypothetical protein VPH35_052577 [Triticum aestivum]